MFSRYYILRKIQKLDPQVDDQQIVYLVGSYEYPWLTQRSLEFALFRTFAVPSISRLLDETGQFARHGQRRYDDTALILAEITENGYDSERGRAAIRQMNRQHRRYDIANEDYLYVLSTFIYEPTRWHERYGWRQPTEGEKQANYVFWCEVGRRMGIQDIPTADAAFKLFNIDYEREHFTYSESNQRVGEATIQIFLSWYPRFLRPLLRPIIYALMDEPLRRAFGFPSAPAWARLLAHTGLKALAVILRFMPPRRTPYSLTRKHNRSYPNGYQIDRL